VLLPLYRKIFLSAKLAVNPLFAEGKWKVWVTTNELPSAGTQAQVTLTVYGHRGCTKAIPLGSPDGETFQAGNVDEFTVRAPLLSTANFYMFYVISTNRQQE